MMTLVYKYGDKLYLNITNRCDCACVFCIRGGADGVGDDGSLWLERDPTADEVIADIKKRDLSQYREVVFCGYGEPTEHFDVLLAVCRWLRAEHPEMPVRLNTNGLCELSLGRPVAHELEGLVDTISISLNAPSAARYNEVTRPRFGGEAFDAMLSFAGRCKQYIPNVIFSVVDVLSPAEIERCEALADEMAIPLRVRRQV